MAPKDPSATATRRRQRQRGWLGAIAGGLKRALDPFGLFVNRREPREDEDETSSSSQEQSDSHHREDVGEEVVKLGEQQQEQERVGAEGQRRSAGEGEGGEGEGEGDSGEEMSDLAAAGNAAAAVAVGGRGDDWREVAAAAEGRLEASQGGEEREEDMEEMEDLLVNNAAVGDFRDRKGDQQREKADQELELIHKGLLQPLWGMGEGEGGGEMDEREEAEEGEQEEGEEYGGGAVGGASEELTAAVMDVAFGVQAGDGAEGEGGGTGGVGKVQGPATRQLRERIHRRKRQQQQLMQQGEMQGQEQEQLMQQGEMQGQGQEQEQQGRVQQVVVASRGEEGRVVQQGQAGVLQSALHEPLGGGVRVGGSTSPVTRYPMDVFEDDTSYELQADVPGMSEHDVMVEVDAHSLVVEGTHVDRVERQQHMVVPRVGPEPHSGASAGAAPAPPPGPGGRSMVPQPAGALAAGGEASDRPGPQTTRRTVRLERQRRRHFRRTFRLPHDVDPTAITASLLDGVLIVRLAKATAAAAARGNGNVGPGGGGANRMLPPELAAAAETAAACVLRDLGGEVGPGAGVRRTAGGEGGEGGEPPKPKRRHVRVDRLPAAVVDPYDIVLAVEVAEAAAAEGVEPADGEEEGGGGGGGGGGDDVAAVGEEVGMVGAGAGGGGDGGEGGGSGSVSTVGEELGVGVGGVDGGEGGNEEEARRGAMLAEAVAAGALEPLPTAEAVAVTSPAAPAANYGAAVVSYDSPDKRERWEGDEVPRSDVGIGEVGKGVGVGGGGGGGVPPLAPVTPRPAKGADTQGQ